MKKFPIRQLVDLLLRLFLSLVWAYDREDTCGCLFGNHLETQDRLGEVK